MKVIRVLIYEGNEEWIRATFERNAIDKNGFTMGNKAVVAPHLHCNIKEVFCGKIVPRTSHWERAVTREEIESALMDIGIDDVSSYK